MEESNAEAFSFSKLHSLYAVNSILPLYSPNQAVLCCFQIASALRDPTTQQGDHLGDLNPFSSAVPVSYPSPGDAGNVLGATALLGVAASAS